MAWGSKWLEIPVLNLSREEKDKRLLELVKLATYNKKEEENEMDFWNARNAAINEIESKMKDLEVPKIEDLIKDNIQNKRKMRITARRRRRSMA